VKVFSLVCLGCAKRYPVEGLVIRVDPAQRVMLVSHRAIKGYMPAMTMPFHVAPKEDLGKVAPGTRVGFQLRVGRHESIAVNLKPRVTKLEGVNGEEIKVPPPMNKVALGGIVPDFTLTDQRTRPVRLADFRGRIVAIDFIYTRCPLPDVCPRLSANFAYLAKRLRGRDLTLLSITIDPTYDRPDVLAEYAHRWGADGETWHFLTGTADQIQTVAGLFGLVYWAEEGSITHTAATALVGRDGKLLAMVEGSSYRPDQLRDLVEHAFDAQ
jgi:protein SCO1/2